MSKNNELLQLFGFGDEHCVIGHSIAEVIYSIPKKQVDGVWHIDITVDEFSEALNKAIKNYKRLSNYQEY